MDRLDAMTLFVSAVRLGSLAGAARAHGRSPASVTRAVALLERQAGEPLLVRSTRRLRLTPAGERHLVVWSEVLGRLGEIGSEEGVQGQGGSLVLTAPELFGRLKVMPILETFLATRPNVSARAVLVNRIVDLVGEGMDVAVRLAVLPDSSLTAIRFGEVRTLVCAAPAYLENAPALDTPHDLAGQACIGLNAESDGELWSFSVPNDRRAKLRSVRASTRLSVNNAGAALDAARRGNGLVRARSYQVAEDLASGRLVAVLADYEPPPDPAHLVFHPDRGRRATVRAFVDEAVPALRSELSRISLLLGADSRT